MKLKLFDKTRDKRILKGVIMFIFLLASIIVIFNDFFADEFLSETGTTDGDEVLADCNVVGIELHGELVTYIPPSDYDVDGNITFDETASENIVATINDSDRNDAIKVILLEIDSYGGSPVAAEEVATALKNAKKPTVAMIRQAGVSAAYWSATGANRIFASANSDVGGIGVTMSYLDASKENQKTGLTYNQLSSGKFKDTGDPDKPLSAEETKLLMRDVDIIHQNFIKAVAENRKLDVGKVASLADGSTVLGDMALQNGLIDQIGSMPEVQQYLKDKIGEEAEICW